MSFCLDDRQPVRAAANRFFPADALRFALISVSTFGVFFDEGNSRLHRRAASAIIPQLFNYI
jgi:hypothetical protein